MSTERLVQDNDIEQNPTLHSVAQEPIPEIRKERAWWASIAICSLTAAVIVYFGVTKSKTLQYKPLDRSSANLKAIKNGTLQVYTREEKKTYPILFNLGFGLLAIMLGIIVDRLSLLFEESFHFKSRYNRNLCNMVRTCFSGLSGGAILAVVIIIAVCVGIPLENKATFEIKYILYILSGIGVGPLMMRLLNLNAQSDVHISTILEEKETYVANGLAWTYYFSYLDKTLKIFLEATSQHSQNKESPQLTSNKLILLISHDCTMADDLSDADNTITIIPDFFTEEELNYTFRVYEFTYKGQRYRYAIEYVKQPLKTLLRMTTNDDFKALNREQLDYQVKLLYRTLSDILKIPLETDYRHRERCILVPIKAERTQSLQNGGLVNCIMKAIEEEENPLAQKRMHMLVPSINPSSSKNARNNPPESDSKNTEDDDNTNEDEPRASTSFHGTTAADLDELD